jgi:hypothetical protein
MQTACHDRATFCRFVEISAGTVKLKMILGDYRMVGAVIAVSDRDSNHGLDHSSPVGEPALNDPLLPEAMSSGRINTGLPTRTQIRDVEVDADRPTLRRRTTPYRRRSKTERWAMSTRVRLSESNFGFWGLIYLGNVHLSTHSRVQYHRG